MTKQKLYNWSISAFQTWQQCEQRYDYQYRRRIKPRLRDVAPERGVLLHKYFESYYRALKEEHTPATAHSVGIEQLRLEQPRLHVMAATAKYAGDDKLADEYYDLPRVLETIAGRYYTLRGLPDAAQYNVLVVEARLRTLLVAGVESSSIIDLVLQDRASGLNYLVEHKTTANIPSSAFRIRDLQTTLYARILERYGIKIDYILWNYVRTKEPVVPQLLKPRGKNAAPNSAGLSRAKDMDTTWPVYYKAIMDNDLDPEDYQDVYDRLKNREETVFLPRYSHPVMVDQEKLLYDYAVEAQRARTSVEMWDRGLSIPVRSLTRMCDWCPYFAICEAVLMGGDEESIIEHRYISPKDYEDATNTATAS